MATFIKKSLPVITAINAQKLTITIPKISMATVLSGAEGPRKMRKRQKKQHTNKIPRKTCIVISMQMLLAIQRPFLKYFQNAVQFSP